jgi:ABC-type multidrug transport system ATPase subunit
LLADNVIVMQKGDIVAAGTPLRLKSKYGKGYRLTLASVEESLATKPPIGSAVLESSAAGQVVWRIEEARDLIDVARWVYEKEQETQMRQRKEEVSAEETINIQGWEISMPTLEDVLLEKNLF